MNKSINRILILIFVNVLFFSCTKKTKPIVNTTPTYDVLEEVEIDDRVKQPIEPIPKTPPKPYVLVSLQKLGCFGKCPDYEFVLMSNGEATFHGKKYSERIGKYYAQTQAGIIFNIQSKIKEVDFFQFEKMYPTNGKVIKELPDTYVLVNHNQEQLIIRNNHDAPKALIDFEKFIEEIMDGLKWQKVE